MESSSASRPSKSTRPGPRKEEEEGEADVVVAETDMALDVVEVDMVVEDMAEDVVVAVMVAAEVAMEADRAGTEAEDMVNSRVDRAAVDTADTRLSNPAK